MASDLDNFKQTLLVYLQQQRSIFFSIQSTWHLLINQHLIECMFKVPHQVSL